MTDSTPASGGDLGTPPLQRLMKTLAITLAALLPLWLIVRLRKPIAAAAATA